MRRIVSALTCFAVTLSLSGTAVGAPPCPPVVPSITPAWVDIMSNNSPGTAFLFSGMNRNPRRPDRRLPFTVRIPPDAIGAPDPHTFPSGPPFYSNASGASIDCLPGLSPNLFGVAPELPLRPERPLRTLPGCPAGQVGVGCGPDGDCTGRPILRTPAAGVASPLSNGITGIRYLGTFDGESTGAPSGVVQVVFFSQSADYLAKSEYGFLRDLAFPNQLTFYWQTNANCTLPANAVPNDTMCTTLEGNRQPSNFIYTDDLLPPGNSPGITAACSIDLGPTEGFGLYYYSMWIFSDSGTLKFGISIVDPNTLLPVVPETSIDPNVGASTTWFPISALNGGSGYVTAGIARYDPFRNQSFSNPVPAMSIERMAIGTAP